jgi:conjugal transfer ATP-binding protein TraC
MGKLLRRQKLATSETGGHVRNIQAEIARGESEGMIALAARENQRIFQSSVTVIVTGQSEAELDASTAAMKDAFRNAGDMSTEVGRQLKSFLSSLPGCGFLSPRSWGIHTNAAADLVPYFVPTTGDPEAQLVYHTRQSSLFRLSYSANTHRTNRNGLVFGPAGTGKSFTIANIFEQAGLADGCSVDVIDVQGPAVSNYKVLAELFGGAYIPLGSGDGSVGLNAFPAPDDLLQRNEENGQFVINERGTRDIDQNKLREAAATALLIGAPHYASDPLAALYEEVAQEALRLAYKNVRHRHLQGGGTKETAPGPVVTDFIAVLDPTAQTRDQAPDTLEPRGPEYVEVIRKLVVTLTSRMRNPTWARLLNRRTAQPAVQFRVYDFFGMDKEPELASVLIQMMTNQVWDTIQATGREKSKHIYYDECWKLIAHPTAAANIAELFRTGRKWGASVWAITQSLDDLRQTPVAKALLANSSTVWLNRHAIDHDSVAEFCGLNSRQTGLFRSLEFKKNQYSEILFVDRTTSGATVLRSKPTPFDLWINTTNPADVGFRERVRRERNVSMAEAIRYCAENHPQGAPR